MPQLDGTLVVVAVFIFLLLLSKAMPRRVVVRIARRVGEWAAAHRQQTEEWDDPEEQQLWLIERRRKLCADLRRIEHLLATDEWMSATRQRGNRIAYDRLVDDLRRIPDVFPTLLQTQTFDPWDEPTTDPRFTGLLTNGSTSQGRTVEVLEIGWGRRRR
jgi:hypothetical protein